VEQKAAAFTLVRRASRRRVAERQRALDAADREFAPGKIGTVRLVAAGVPRGEAVVRADGALRRVVPSAAGRDDGGGGE
jgi:hypothetical protein